MAETDILNPVTSWDDDIQDNPCPDYGFTRKRPNSRVSAKPPGGQPFSREVSNDGHTFSLSWLNRSFACVQYIKRFCDRFEDGFFTVVDYDGGGRHFVGRFTGDCNIVQQGNDSYSIQDLTFTEIPGVPMMEYPSDWDNDAIDLAMFSDFGQQRAAVSGTWNKGVGYDVVTLDSAGVLNDSATIEYRGYGFQVWMIQGAASGQVEISLDDVVLGTVDLYTSDPNVSGPQSVFVKGDVPLDLHRVKVRALGTKNDASSYAGVRLVKLQVMR